MKKSWCLLLTLLFVWASAAAQNPAMAVPNLEFEKWDNGMPAGWGALTPGYTASHDCNAAAEGRCVLKLQSIAGAASTAFFPLGRRTDPGAASGHRLTLSGRIRTEGVTGNAALWLRADAPRGPPLGFDNMQSKAPKGTSGWSPFSVSVPVPPNASAIVLGVMLVGSGTAWFDGLQLTVDQSVVVAPAVLPPKVPPRAPASPELLSDAALRIAPDAMVHVDDAWRADVAARVHPIRSLYSDDFSDLQFLKPLLAGKRVVQLGESGHGVGEFNLAKVRLIKFLHQQMGYDVIAVESSLPQCYEADKAIASSPPLAVMKQCMFAVWHSKETLPLFEYLQTVRQRGGRLSLAGFDTQDSSSAPAARELLARMLALDGWPRAVELAANETALTNRSKAAPLEAHLASKLAAFYGDVATELEQNRAKLSKAGAEPDELARAIQTARSRVRLVGQFGATAIREGFESRDQGMADNIDFLLDTMYPGRKVIVWAHNAHVANLPPFGGAKSMGMFIAERRKAEVYTVGLFMGRGFAAQNDRKVYPIAAPDADSFDAVLSNAGLKFAFVDFSTAKAAPATNWIFAPIVMREWGRTKMTVTPANGYDGVLYIDTVTPPEYR